ncbi:MAG: hypothetical protein K8S94_02635 [Planctomycetia bacterium]|nr:hypothetical protein [Planctomycetia bacterium]
MMTAASRRSAGADPTTAADKGGPGSALVIGLLALAVALALFAVWFQWNQTRRCLGFYGTEAARSIQGAPRVELWRLAVDPVTGRLGAIDRREVSRAPGLVHLRRGLVEDANFAWPTPAGDRRPADAWDHALAFFDAVDGERPTAVVAIDLDGEGWLTVAGRPGRVALGRLQKGLRTWIEATSRDVP